MMQNIQLEDVENILEQIESTKIIEDKIQKCIELKLDTLELANINIEILQENFFEISHLKKLILKDMQINSLNILNSMCNKNLQLLCLEICNNNIDILDCNVLPNTLQKFNFSNNNTETIIGDFKEGLIELNLSCNKITNINCLFPVSIEILDLTCNELLKKLPNLSQNINFKKIDISDTLISNIDILPDNICYLESCNCHIEVINKLPSNLIVWKSFNGCISKILCNFPINIEELDLYNNNLQQIPEIPTSCINIDLRNNNLFVMPKFSLTNQIQIDLRNNNKLIIPNNIKELNIDTILFDNNKFDDNYINIFQNIIKNRDNSSYYDINNPHYIVLDKIFTI
jgi:hypothetical protein